MSGRGQKHSFVQNRLPSFVFTNAGEKKNKTQQQKPVKCGKDAKRAVKEPSAIHKEHKFGMVYLHARGVDVLYTDLNEGVNSV